MKFSDLAITMKHAALLYSDVSREAHDELSAIASALDRYPVATTASVTKILKKKKPDFGAAGDNANFPTLKQLSKFFVNMGFVKQSKALKDLEGFVVRFGIREAQQLNAALDLAHTVVVAPSGQHAALHDELVARYVARLLECSSLVGGAAEILKELKADKKGIRVEEARVIASKVTGVALGKSQTRAKYIQTLESKFIILDREQSKLTASKNSSKTWSTK
jgi:hypothetical protein